MAFGPVTILGVIFIAAYAVGLAINGRIGLLAVAAAAIPFNSSAAILIGDELPLTPFYLGMLIYLPLVYIEVRLPQPQSSLPWLLGLWGIMITLIGPTIFAGMPVVASGVGLDQQVGWLSELDYTTSNVAQIIYLVLNLALLMALAASQDTKQWIPPIPAFVGTWVAMAVWILREVGIDWPRTLFANSARRSFAPGEGRFAAQFTEPSLLGTFALTSFVILAAMLVSQRRQPSLAFLLFITAAADLFLIFQSSALTSLAGAGVFIMLVALAGSYRIAFTRARIPLILPLILLVLAVATPPLVEFGVSVIDYKLSTRHSMTSRFSADATSWQLFWDSGGLGVGMGSNRSSSMMLLLLSSMGIIGAALFIMLMGRAIHDGLQSRPRLPWVAGLVALLVSSMISLADLVSPMIWLLAGFCWKTDPRALTTRWNSARGGPTVLKAHGRLVSWFQP